MEFLDACRKIISIDSTPGNGTRDIAQFVHDLCVEFGMKVELQEGVLNGIPQANVIARPQNPTDEEVMLQTHLDTGDPGNYALWIETGKNPFDALVSGDRIYGLGAAKSKLDFLCKLYAMKNFSTHQFRRSPVLVGTYGQQLGMSGAMQLLRHNRVRPLMALVGEPTNLTLIASGKGVVVVEVQVPFDATEKKYRLEHDEMESTSSMSRMFMGKAASTSDPGQGENAIEKMLEELSNMPRETAILDIDGGVNVHAVPTQAHLEIDFCSDLKSPVREKLIEVLESLKRMRNEFEKCPDESFDPPISTVNLGRIRTFEDHISLSSSCRLVPVEDPAIYDQWLQELRDTCDKLGAQFRMAEFKRPFKTPERSEVVEIFSGILTDFGLDNPWGRQAKSNEANVYSRLGVECVIFGAGEVTANAHTPNESVALADLDRATQIYTQFIERECL